MSFWKELKKPIFALAPMADVTDVCLRRVIAKYGKPDVMFTEFVSADGLAFAPEEGRKKLLKDLEYSESERPIVAQFFTSSPDNMEKAARLAEELGFDGVDINMGCPDRSIEKQGAGAAMMKKPEIAIAVIEAVRESGLPVSVKTRLGFNKIELDWIKTLLSVKLSALTIHLRTRKEMSKVAAHWELAREIVELRNHISPETLILFNGDVQDLDDARRKCEETGCDGAMLGRAIFGNPWLFSSVDIARKNALSFSAEKSRSTPPDGVRDVFSLQYQPSMREKLEVLIEHTKLFEELLGGYKNFAIMKKHFKAYVNTFDGAGELRGKLMETNNAGEVEEVIKSFLL